MLGFFLVLFSAFMHALWNFLLKKSSNKYIFNYQMHIANLIIFSMVYPVFFGKYLYYDFYALKWAFISAIFFSFYHLSLSTSYRFADISLVYPVTTSSPFLVLLLARIFLGEKITFSGFMGVTVIIFGVVILNVTKIKGSFDGKGLFYAILAAFFYSLGAIVDKNGVGVQNFVLYVYALSFFMTIFLTAQSVMTQKGHLVGFNRNFSTVIISGVILFLSFITYRYGLTFMEVSYASALRQVNALFGFFIAVFYLKEGFSLKRMLGAIVIFAGAVLIRINI